VTEGILDRVYGSLIGGALHRASAIRSDRIATVEAAHEDSCEELEGDPFANVFSMAQRLVDALRAERQASQDRAALLSQMLA
jgi:hypothetical protein